MCIALDPELACVTTIVFCLTISCVVSAANLLITWKRCITKQTPEICLINLSCNDESEGTNCAPHYRNQY